MNVITHDRIKVSSGRKGVLKSTRGVLWGGNAIQQITIGRHTPTDPVQAMGYLGIVDFTSGTVTSDVSIDTILVESCDKPSSDASSVYKYAAQSISVGQEQYVLTGNGVNFQAGSPATANYSYITGTMASYLDVQSTPSTVQDGEEDVFAVVMGDDGSGIELVPTWYDGNSGGTAKLTANIPYIDANGSLVSSGINALSDNGIPAGVQSVSFSSNINRDQILDVRVAGAMQFITTYPVDVTVDMEMYDLAVLSSMSGYKPGDASYNPDRDAGSNKFAHVLNQIKDLSVVATNWNKHPSAAGATPASDGDIYVKAIGLKKQDEQEAVSVGRYLMYTFNFRAADLWIPLPALS